jgi:hypothetical protein
MPLPAPPAPVETVMADLIARLKVAEGPDRELDKQIWQLLVPNVTRRTIHVDHHSKPYDIDETRDASGRLIIVPSYTTSLDAALALVREVNPSFTVRLTQGSTWFVEIQNRGTERPFTGLNRHPAIALCLALLSALELEGEE